MAFHYNGKCDECMIESSEIILTKNDLKHINITSEEYSEQIIHIYKLKNYINVHYYINMLSFITAKFIERFLRESHNLPVYFCYTDDDMIVYYKTIDMNTHNMKQLKRIISTTQYNWIYET